MGRLSRRLSIASSRGRGKSLNRETGATDVNDAGLSQDLSQVDTIGGNGGETQVQETGTNEGATVVSGVSAPQKRRSSFLARLRRRSSSVAPAPVDNSPAAALPTVSDEIGAAAAAAEGTRKVSTGGTDDAKTQRGRESRRSSFTVLAKARAALSRRSVSRASSRENGLNTNTRAASLAPTPSRHSCLEATSAMGLIQETVKTNSPYVPVGIPLARYPTEDGHDEEVAPFTHLPLDQDPVEVDLRDSEETCITTSAPAATLEQSDIACGKEEPAAEQEDAYSKDDMALSETPDQLTVVAPPSLCSASDATDRQDNVQQQQADEVPAKVEEEGVNAKVEKPKRKLGLAGRKKESRSSGGSTKNESRKERDGKALKNRLETRETGGDKQSELSTLEAAETVKSTSNWRRRLSLSRERHHSTQSGPLTEEKTEGGSYCGHEKGCTDNTGENGYLGRIRRRLSLSRDRRGESISRKSDGTEEEEKTSKAGRNTTKANLGAHEVEGVKGSSETEGEPSAKKTSRWGRLRRNSATSAVAAVRGRSRDARGLAGAQQQGTEITDTEAQQEEGGSLAGEKLSLAKSLRRRLSRSSLRLPRSNSRESSIGSRCPGENESLCGNTDEGTDSLATGKERKTWRRRLSDRFRSKSREPPLPSPKAIPPAIVGLTGGASTEGRKLCAGDVRNSESANDTSNSAEASEENVHDVVEESAQPDAKLPSERQDTYNSSGDGSSGEKQAHAKGILSEELSEPFAVTPETSQAPSEQPSSADMTPRYQGQEYFDGQKYHHQAQKPAAHEKRDCSAYEEKTHGEGPDTEGKGKNVIPRAEDLEQWMDQCRDEDKGDEEDEEEEEDDTLRSTRDEGVAKDYELQRAEDSWMPKKTNAETQRKKFPTFFCCGSDDSDTANEKKWKNSLQKCLVEDEGGEGRYINAHHAYRRISAHSPQPLLCKDLFDDPEMGCGYLLSYAPTDCLLELGMAI